MHASEQDLMFVQVEITTRCNFDCFYCAGRAMRQDDMPYQLFVDLLEQHVAEYGVPDTVSLQGEGEPTLHHDFFRMAEYVAGIGAQPYTITNGTYKHPEHFKQLFPQVGVSVDTVDDAAAEVIGRYNLPRVKAFVQSLARHLKVVIHSVAHVEHSPAVAAWCKENNYAHVIQPLQTKPDYAVRYQVNLPLPEPVGKFSCGYLQAPRMRYYSLDGIEMPCCFIKDAAAYEGMQAMHRHQSSGSWPKLCVGCRYAQSKA
jgi:MoaA/NifB/PqqE/SkfB family radical SAM enzyme